MPATPVFMFAQPRVEVLTPLPIRDTKLVIWQLPTARSVTTVLLLLVPQMLQRGIFRMQQVLLVVHATQALPLRLVTKR